MMMMSGPEQGNEPIKVGFPVIDIAVGMLGALSVTSAIYRQEKYGVGQYIDTSLVQAALMLMYPFATDYLTDKKITKRLGNKGYSGSPASDTFQCKDGWISTAANTPAQFRKMMSLLKLDQICTNAELLDLDAFNAVKEGFVIAKNPNLVKQKIQDALSETSAEELELQLNEVGVPAAKIRTLSEFLDELLHGENITTSFMKFEQANKTIKTAGLGFTLDEGEQLITAGTPTLGQHNYELLKSIGINEDQITKMMAANLLK